MLTTKSLTYLSNRRQRVKLSTWQDITTGIPHGSAHGPVLFNIFMNDLVNLIKGSNLSTYADDTRAFFADKRSFDSPRNYKL